MKIEMTVMNMTVMMTESNCSSSLESDFYEEDCDER